MIRTALYAHSLSQTAELRWRFRFSVLTIGFTIILLSWGAVVTSIEAGLAVPDWPTSFNSIDPVNPIPRWWAVPSVLAEHGHRLMGLIVGFATLILVSWTLLKEDRRWVKVVAIVAFLLVILQGVLGGLRVVWVSLDLAVVHACVAQLFFSTLVSLAYFTSKKWLDAAHILDEGNETGQFRKLTIVTAGGIYVQIILGALLRHPGAGINLWLLTTHLAGALVVTGLIFLTFRESRRIDPIGNVVRPYTQSLLGIVGIQFILGLAAYGMISVDASMGRSVFPTILSTAHMVTGAMLLATAIVLLLAGARTREATPRSTL